MILVYNFFFKPYISKIYNSFSLYIYIYIYIVESKDLATPTHFISSSRSTPRRKKCPRTNKEGPSCQKISSRTILSSANRNRKKEKRHALKNSLLGRPKQKGLTQWASHESMVEEQF